VIAAVAEPVNVVVLPVHKDKVPEIVGFAFIVTVVEAVQPAEFL
jgi:hypothetical protein